MRRRNLPAVRERILHERMVASTIRSCLTHGCVNMSKTHHGPYTGLCDDCIAELGYHSALA